MTNDYELSNSLVAKISHAEACLISNHRREDGVVACKEVNESLIKIGVLAQNGFRYNYKDYYGKEGLEKWYKDKITYYENQMKEIQKLLDGESDA